jgi:hypothetical protein
MEQIDARFAHCQPEWRRSEGGRVENLTYGAFRIGTTSPGWGRDSGDRREESMTALASGV